MSKETSQEINVRSLILVLGLYYSPWYSHNHMVKSSSFRVPRIHLYLPAIL